MGSESVFNVFRVVWTRFIVQRNRFSPSGAAHAIRENLANLACGEHQYELKAKRFAETLNIRVQKACSLFTRRCNVIAGQRVWRAFQIVSLYRQLYGEKRLMQTLRANLLRHRNLYTLLSAVGIFQWERDGISDKDMQCALAEMEDMDRLVTHAQKTNTACAPCPDGWDMVIDRPHLKVWRRYMSQYNLFEYRVYGTFTDITPMAFYNTQMDLKFWCSWDQQTMEINVVDTDADTNSEVIHWVYKYPYPMYPRDYCYIRRNMVNREKNRIVIKARAVEHHKCPECQDIVRVKQYQSQLVIEPHSTFTENGFEFYMTYFDDPQTKLPRLCYNWLASTGVPDFVDQLHQAAMAMQERTRRGYHPNVMAGTAYHSAAEEDAASKLVHNVQQEQQQQQHHQQYL